MDMEVHLSVSKIDAIKPTTSQESFSSQDSVDTPSTPLNTTWLRKRYSAGRFSGYSESTVENCAKNIHVPKHVIRQTASEAEEWQRFPHIERGYRKAGLTYVESILSMFGSLHNETLNVWTMVAAVFAGAWLFSRYFWFDPGAPKGWDASPFWALLIAQMSHAPAAIG